MPKYRIKYSIFRTGYEGHRTVEADTRAKARNKVRSILKKEGHPHIAIMD